MFLVNIILNKCVTKLYGCLTALNIVPDWPVTSKMIWKLFTALYADKNILYFNDDSSNATFCCNEMDILSVNLDNINFDDTNYEKDDPDTIIPIRLLALHIKFERHKTFNKRWRINWSEVKNLSDSSEELMLIAWNSKTRWNFLVSEDEKKEIEPIFIEEL